MANEVVINVDARTRDAQRGFGRLESRMQSFTRTARNVGLGLMAIGGIGIFAIKKSVDAALEQERAMRTLETIVEANGQSFAEFRSEVEETTAALQRKTNFGDEEQLRVLARMVPVLGDTEKALQALPAVLDAASARQQGAAEVATTLSKALSGQVDTAESLGLRFDETADFMARLERVQAAVGGAAEANRDPFQQLDNALGDLRETIGDELLPVVIPLLENLNKFIQALGDLNPMLLRVGVVTSSFGIALATVLGSIALLMAPIGGLIKVLRPVVRAIGRVVVALTPFIRQLSAVGRIIRLVVFGPFGLLLAVIGLLILAFWRFREKIGERLEGIKGAIEGVFVGEDSTWAVARRTVSSKIEAMKDALNDFGESLKAKFSPEGVIGGALETFEDAWESVAETVESVWEEIVRTMKQGVRDFIEGVNAVIDAVNALASKLPFIDELIPRIRDPWPWMTPIPERPPENPIPRFPVPMPTLIGADTSQRLPFVNDTPGDTIGPGGFTPNVNVFLDGRQVSASVGRNAVDEEQVRGG